MQITDDLARAYATLSRGANVFARGPATSPPRSRRAHVLYSKVLGNGLRELDRFLNLLIDEVARREGVRVRSSQRNTANKLKEFRLALAVADTDHARLRALGRSRNCLFHCNGIARYEDPNDPTTMVLGWPIGPETGQPLRRIPLTEPIMLAPADIESVGLFYTGLADALTWAPSPCFRPRTQC